MKKAFTLIELLIVVLIIAILAAIAVPNFLEFQMRAKVSRVKSDHRSMATAIEAYRIDAGRYPEYSDLFTTLETLSVITTPIAYMTQIPQDPFEVPNGRVYGVSGFDRNRNYSVYLEKIGIARWNVASPPLPLADWEMNQQNWLARMPITKEQSRWALVSRGPDSDMYYFEPITYGTTYTVTDDWYYDPTNGTVSRGDILRFGP